MLKTSFYDPITTATKAVLFDIDGTILDTHDSIFRAVKYTLDKHGLSVTEEQLIRAKGKPLKEFYKSLFPELEHDLLAKTHHDYVDGKPDMSKVFPNVEQVLKKLKTDGILIAAVSNRAKVGLVESLKSGKVYKYFDVILGLDDVKNPKPHKDHPLKALEILGIDQESAIMVGDTENDILAGKNAGIKTVGVTYGWIGQDIKNHKPDFVIDGLEELLKVLKY